jgi:ribosome-associated translation inhibitor RaiA
MNGLVRLAYEALVSGKSKLTAPLLGIALAVLLMRRQAMKRPVQITFRNLEPSPIVEEWVRAETGKLETFYNHIMSCRVALEIPHRHHRKGKQCHVRIDLTLPGKELVIKREPTASSRSRGSRAVLAGKVAKIEPHHDLRLVIHDAFKAAGRRVQDFARLHRGDVKNHRPAMRLVS